jgi:nucleoside 2-deoxyribosyltransferase
MKHAYIAAPFFSPAQITVVDKIESLLLMHGYTYFSPYAESRAIWKGRAPKDCTAEERKAVINGNVRGLVQADVLVTWGGGTDTSDTGVVWEMGYFYAITEYEHDDKQRFTLAYVHQTDTKQNLNLMLAETVDAAVYGQASLSRALRILSYGELDACRTEYPPSKLFLHEKEPIA